MEIKQYKERN